MHSMQFVQRLKSITGYQRRAGASSIRTKVVGAKVVGTKVVGTKVVGTLRVPLFSFGKLEACPTTDCPAEARPSAVSFVGFSYRASDSALGLPLSQPDRPTTLVFSSW